MFELDFFKPKKSEGVIKLTVHRNGKLGFSKMAMDKLNIGEWKQCKFAKDKNAESNDVIYMVRADEPDDVSFNISKAGDYYYIKANSLLEDLGIDYADPDKTIKFDITPIDNNGTTIYKLTKKESKKRIINKKAE